MAEKNVLSCRGCLTEVDGIDSYFFVLKKVRDLFTGCTAIEILPEEDECFPQQLCSSCYDKCREWLSFKEMCQKVDKRLQRKAIKSVPIQGDEVPTIWIKEEVQMDVDESADLQSFIVGDVFKEEKEDEEDGKSQVEAIENEEGEKCPVCDVIIPHSRSLKEHVKEHYSEENPKCPICDQQFTRSSQVHSHIMSVHKRGGKGEQSEMPKEREIQVCPEREVQTDQLLHNLTSVQLERGQVEGPVCKKNLKDLKRHMVEHTIPVPVKVLTDILDKLTVIADVVTKTEKDVDKLSTHIKNTGLKGAKDKTQLSVLTKAVAGVYGVFFPIESLEEMDTYETKLKKSSIEVEILKVHASKMGKKCLAGLLSREVIAVFSLAGRDPLRKIESSFMLRTVLDVWEVGSTRGKVLKQMREETDDARKSLYQKNYHSRKRAAESVVAPVAEGEQQIEEGSAGSVSPG